MQRPDDPRDTDLRETFCEQRCKTCEANLNDSRKQNGEYKDRITELIRSRDLEAKNNDSLQLQIDALESQLLSTESKLKRCQRQKSDDLAAEGAALQECQLRLEEVHGKYESFKRTVENEVAQHIEREAKETALALENYERLLNGCTQYSTDLRGQLVRQEAELLEHTQQMQRVQAAHAHMLRRLAENDRPPEALRREVEELRQFSYAVAKGKADADRLRAITWRRRQSAAVCRKAGKQSDCVKSPSCRWAVRRGGGRAKCELARGAFEQSLGAEDAAALAAARVREAETCSGLPGADCAARAGECIWIEPGLRSVGYCRRYPQMPWAQQHSPPRSLH